jgi:hypothetical protein
MPRRKAAFTLIGDVVSSREAGDRGGLQKTIGAVLDEMTEEFGSSASFEPTIGDEFQAWFSDVPSLVRASLMIRLALLRTAGVDSRYGLGVGPVEVFERRSPVSQDGPGWWAAREAIERAKQLAASPQTSDARTFFKAGEAWARRDGEVATINAFLLSRDAIVNRMKTQSRSRLYGLMRGWSQSQIAEEEGATQGAVSQTLARSGSFTILIGQEMLEGKLP